MYRNGALKRVPHLVGWSLVFRTALLAFVILCSTHPVHADVREDLPNVDLLIDYLDDPLWIGRDIYDAARTLMIPMYYAFSSNDTHLQALFADHFCEFANTLETDPKQISQGRLNRLCYWYLVSRFMVLSLQHDAAHLIPANLEERLLAELRALWSETAAWQWAHDPFPGGMKERLDWKLSVPSVKRSYYRSIIDEELYTLAIGADMLHASRLQGVSPAPFLVEIQDMAWRVFHDRVAWKDDGGWLFDLGAWTDHPTYAYAGYQQEPASDDEPLRISDVATDTAHSQRHVLWLRSLAGSYEYRSEGWRYYVSLLRGFDTRFRSHVLVSPDETAPCYRTTNFIDGSNGVFRWDYATCPDDGYLPYESSGTILCGWWALLSSEAQHIYLRVLRTLPPADCCMDFYVGPNTSRDRHPLVVWPDYFENGFAELIARMAVRIDLAQTFPGELRVGIDLQQLQHE